MWSPCPVRSRRSRRTTVDVGEPSLIVDERDTEGGGRIEHAPEPGLAQPELLGGLAPGKRDGCLPDERLHGLPALNLSSRRKEDACRAEEVIPPDQSHEAELHDIEPFQDRLADLLRDRPKTDVVERP